MLKEVIFLLSVLVCGSYQQCLTRNDDPDFVGPTRYNDWLISRHNFSVALLQSLNKHRNGKDIAFSPLTIHDLLLLLYFGAGDGTEKSLNRVLNIPFLQNKGTIWNFYKNHKISDVEDVDPEYPLRTATKLFLSNNMNLRPCMEEMFRSDIEVIDTQSDPQDAVYRINQWVEHRTFGHIKDYIIKLSPRSTLTIVNAAYFEGVWEYKFNGTQIMTFHMNDYESTEVEMMYTRDIVYKAFNPNLEAHVLLLPFRGNDVVIVFILPTGGLDSAIESMSDKTIQDITDRRNMKPVKVDLFVPKFEYENEINLMNAMQTLGSGTTFTSFADLSGFTGRRNVFTSNAKHIAAIKLHEEGRKTVQLDSTSDAQTVILDRPFIYVIYDILAQKTLFMGIYAHPVGVFNS